MILFAPAGATSATLSTRRSVPVVNGQVDGDVTDQEIADLETLGFTRTAPAAPAETTPAPEPEQPAQAL